MIGHIKRIIQTEELPPVHVAKYKCQGGCGHKQTCQT
jgi:CRISPR/Cas system-associated exonuclease Cas4 (RecB family)